VLSRTLAISPAADDRTQAFDTFVREHRERAFSLAWRLAGGDRAAAQDILQDALLRAHRGLGSFRGEAALSTWFFRILIRQAHAHRRSRGLRDRLHALFGAEERAHAAPPSADHALRRRIAAALDKLSRGQREAFVLVHLEGFSITEAAEALDKPAGTLKSHLHRALIALRAELEDVRP
jgi:RNA polymerase sigma-70 factor (ECF subfamily)